MTTYPEIKLPTPANVSRNIISPPPFFGVEQKSQTAIEIADKISDRLIEIVKRQFAEADKKS